MIMIMTMKMAKIRNLPFLVLCLFFMGSTTRTIQFAQCLQSPSSSPPPPPKQSSSSPPPSKSSPYYSYKTFKRLGVPAILYSTIAKVAGSLVQLKPNEIAPTATSYVSSSTTTTVADATTTTTTTKNDSQSLQNNNDNIPRLQQRQRRRVALITGSNTGVGFATAKTLVHQHGFEVIIACRDTTKGIQACQAINNDKMDSAAGRKRSRSSTSKRTNTSTNTNTGGMAVFVQPLDLANFTSIHEFCHQVNIQYDTIDVLINNAGRNSAGPATTPMISTTTTTTTTTTSINDNNNNGNDNGNSNYSNGSPPSLDVLFQTNFLGHFLLTNLLLDKCQRIVNLSSVMHHFPFYDNKKNQKAKKQNNTNNNDKRFQNIATREFWEYNAIEPINEATTTSSSSSSSSTKIVRKPYAPSKLAALLFSIELNRRYKQSKGILSIAVNPGSVYSDIWRNYPKFMKAIFRRIYLTTEQGSTTSVAAAVLDFDTKEQNNNNNNNVNNINNNANVNSNNTVFYLQPYWIPFQKENVPPYPLFEMLGPYRGYCLTQPRLPKNHDNNNDNTDNDDTGLEEACKALFEVCERLTGCKFPEES